jgi:outer membrane lipoprotein-sorting protein
MKNVRPIIVLLFLLLLCLPCSKEKPITVSQLLDELAQKAEDIDSYRVDTSMSWLMGGENMTMTGKTAYKKPGMLHTTTSTNMAGGMTTETFWANGIMWSYTPLMKMATRMELPKLQGDPPTQQAMGMPDPLEMLKGLDEENVISIQRKFVDGNEVYELHAVLKFPQSVEKKRKDAFPMMPGKMDFLINVDNGMLYKMIMYGKNDAPVVEQTYTNYELNVPIPDSAFAFTPPEGVQVMDMTEAAKGMMNRMKEKYRTQRMPEK